jgi:hypothetical protein
MKEEKRSESVGERRAFKCVKATAGASIFDRITVEGFAETIQIRPLL